MARRAALGRGAFRALSFFGEDASISEAAADLGFWCGSSGDGDCAAPCHEVGLPLRRLFSGATCSPGPPPLSQLVSHTGAFSRAKSSRISSIRRQIVRVTSRPRSLP